VNQGGYVADPVYGRKLNKMLEILRRARTGGLSKPEIARATQRLLSGTRERDDILANLEEAGMVVWSVIMAANGKARFHYWATDYAPQKDNRMIGVWGEDQGW
jgi:predicted transcriptional regulator